ncbi:hypothetical protein [Klenkia sp. PcliD-1-E]|uniref:hypothetical protein n=1 Tax=Klenkia sp. PcliD-1-E TaxID=2954492 RepID=UPI002097D20C|nr:hypothetical protein [Klenkia sp. PcliD-1-E]MCO7218603.1 hypothetical protein [Klenkia sp. PcliD-1-E]
MTLSHVVAARCALMTLPVLLAACSGSDTPAEPATSSTPTTAAPSTTTDPEKSAVAEATAFVTAYWQTVDQLYTDPTLPIDTLYEVAVDPEAASEAAAIQSFRASGYTQTGQSQVVSTTPGLVDLEVAAAGDLPFVKITACIDVTQVGATSSAGAALTPGQQSPFLVSELTIVNTAYPDSSSWRVSSAPNTQAQACPG